MSEEEIKAIYDSLSEEEKKVSGFSVDVIDGYNLSEAWKKWEQISHRFPMKRFMLFKQEEQGPHVFFVVFVDIVKTAALIQDNYEVFQKAMGFDFHPLELTLQMNDKDSVFWKKLNPYLYGLLFGFGKTSRRWIKQKFWLENEPKKGKSGKWSAALIGNTKGIRILGEASGNVSQQTKDRFPEIPWKQMVGMRNRLIHAYFDVDLDIVWKTVSDSLPLFANILKKIILNYDKSDD